MESPASVHPADETLVSYGLGKLDDTLSETVSKHLEQCDPCRHRVAQLSSDSFVNRLRDAQPKPADTPSHPKTIVEPDPPHGEASAEKDAAAQPAKTAQPEVRASKSRRSAEQAANASAPLVSATLPPELADHAQYEVIRELGRGGMGVVYLARNKLMDRLEVLKVLNKETLAKQGTATRFLREIQSAAKLHHPNVVAAYTALQVGDLLVFAMEYVEGDDLAKLVRARGPLPVVNACYFAYQAAKGLDHAHQRGMIHRDIKPGNLILFREGKQATVKILDFGLAKVTSEHCLDRALTQEGQMLGTPDYIAPEQTLDAQKADIRADIYSLGCTLYHLLTGSPPFGGNSLYEVLQAHHSTDAKMLNLVRPEVTVELAAVVAKMMAKDPNRRYQTPAEVVQALKPFLKPGGSSSSQPEISQVESQIDRPATHAAAVPGAASDDSSPNLAPMEALQPAERWRSLINTPPPDPSSSARSAIRQRARRHPPWMWPSVAVGALLFGLITAWASGVFSVKTREGVIVLQDLPDKADVFVDGEQVNVIWPGGGSPAQITVPPGKRGVQVTKDGFKALAEEVTVESGDRKSLRVMLVPNPITGPSGVPSQSSKTAVTQGDHPPAQGVVSNANGDRTKTLPSDGFVALFNGRDRTNWHAVGPKVNHWSVTQQGVLVGEALGKHSSAGFLITERSDFANFRLRIETRLPRGRHPTDISFRVGPGNGNATGWNGTGVWIESSLHASKNNTGALCRTSDREVPRPLVPADNVPLRPDQWFKLEVIAQGPHIEVFIEGKKVSDLVEETGDRSAGRIKLICRPQDTVEFRTIEIKELPSAEQVSAEPTTKIPVTINESSPPSAIKPADKEPQTSAIPASQQPEKSFVPLFNGKDLTGWIFDGGGESAWHVRDGELIVQAADKDGFLEQGYLLSARDYTDFRLRFQFQRTTESAHSGIALRAVPRERAPASDPAAEDFPFQLTVWIGKTKEGKVEGTGELWWSPNSLRVPPLNVDRLAEIKPIGEWNNMEIELRGQSLRIAVNAREVLNVMLNKTRPTQFAAVGLHRYTGRIGFLKRNGEVRFRNIEIKEFDPDRPAASGPQSSPGEQEFAIAKSQFTKTVQNANDKLLSQLNAHLKSLETSPARTAAHFELIAAAKQERDAFIAQRWIPWSAKMRHSLLTYLSAVHNTERDLEKSFEKAIRRANESHDEPARVKLIAQKDELTTPHVIGKCECIGPKNRKWRFSFYSNGRVNDPKGPSTWICSENLLVLDLHNGNKHNIDKCTLSPDGKTYTAVNQAGYRYQARFASP